MSTITRCALGLAILTVSGAALPAQRGHSRGLREVGIGSAWHLGLALAEPVGQFAQSVGLSPGVDAAFTSGGPLGVRLEGSLLVYGSERWLVPSGSWYYSELETNNIIGSLGIGPQLTLGRGSVRLYAYGMLGFSYFATVMSGDGCSCGDWSSTEYDDVTLARTAGVGMQVALSRGRPWFLDLSARYLHHGPVSYLREGDVDPDGILTAPSYSDANLVVYRLGFSFGGR